ncbi:hypothetical protein HDE_03978 [Halotydeus destructor]|nr:hypothetical protein HDE_03978 [Halotydeus destructor]
MSVIVGCFLSLISHISVYIESVKDELQSAEDLEIYAPKAAREVEGRIVLDQNAGLHLLEAESCVSIECLYRLTKRIETGISIIANYIQDMDKEYFEVDKWLLMENIKSRPNLPVTKVGKIVDNTAFFLTNRFTSKLC